MRPVDKGMPPTAEHISYRDAAPDLIARLGPYCSYCERKIETHLAVEHVQPKSGVPSLKNEWSNFLLSCVSCNSIKSSAAIRLDDYFWPHLDNTLRAFEYTGTGVMNPSNLLGASDRGKAEATLRLVGLDRYPGSPSENPTRSDQRWLRRHEVWMLAQKCVKVLAVTDTIEVRELIVEVAVARGLFSIWWAAFAEEPDMRRRLRMAFPGTAPSCFDANEQPIPRPGGQL